jgi:formylglycine-generating enzyme required for sulfatase activity
VLTSPGGRVSIRVPENVALSTAGLGNLASSTYANFYQDTWTLNLPNSRTMELLRMPGGIFQMGSPLSETGREADETQHQVTISQDYYIARTEVTQAQWLTLQSLPGTQLVFLDDAPVQDANFNEVTAWIAALNAALAGTGTFDLPTEAQWEHACRAGTTTRFSFGNGVGIENNNTCPDVDDAFASMWYSCNRAGATGARRVAQKLANPWGLHDMHGNMFEYVRDRYGVYPSGAVTDPLNTAGASVLVRGGYYDGSAAFARSAERYEVSTGPTTRAFFFGFRIVGRKP